MPAKLIPPEMWKGIPVEPHGPYMAYYWISKEKHIGVSLESMTDGSYRVVSHYKANLAAYARVLTDADGQYLHVWAQTHFLTLMNRAHVKIVEIYTQLIEEALAEAKKAKERADDLLDSRAVANNEGPHQVNPLPFWERLGC